MANKYYLFYISAIVLLKCVAGSVLNSLTFVIDDTYSMSNDIAQVRSGASAIFDTVVFHKDETQIDNFILVTFNDRSDQTYRPDVIVRAKTKDRSVFMSALSAIRTSGGAVTCAELPLAGIKRGLEESRPKSSIYVFTDATAKDFDHYEEVKRLAQSKQCQIVFVITGQCREPTTAPGYQVYQNLAIATDGQVFHMNKGEINKISEYVKKTITGPRTTLVSKNIERGSHTVTFDADSFMGDLLLSLASAITNNPSVNIKAPDGTDVLTNILIQTVYGKVFSVNVTKPGQHTIHVNSPTTSTRAVVTAKTVIDFQHGFSTFIPSSIDDTSTRPAPGAKSYLSIKLTKGNIDLQSVQILDMNNNVLLTLPLATNQDPKFYTTEAFDAPSIDFIIAVIGYDPASRSTITRRAPTPVEVQKTLPGEIITDKAPTVFIEGQGQGIVNATNGEKVQLVCKVEGYPKPDIVWKNKATGTVLSSQVSPGKNYPYDYINVLSIETAMETATYSCEARNRLGFKNQEITVQVTQNRHLSFISGAMNITLECNKTARLFCAVDAFPPATISWYKDDVKLETAGNIKIYTDIHKSSVLTIKNAMPADNGKYTCEARNGDSRKTVIKQIDNFVVVIGVEDVEIDKRVINIAVSKGHSTTVKCKILKGVPKPSITWTLETPSKYIFNVDNWKDQESNIIESANENDAGIYRCQANNGLSEDSHKIDVVVN